MIILKNIDATKLHHKVVFDKLLNNFNFDDDSIHLVPGYLKNNYPFSIEKRRSIYLWWAWVMGMNNNGKFIGNTSEEVLGHIDCNILSIRWRDNKDSRHFLANELY